MRIVAIDYGVKRCGVAATDPLRIIASGVATVDTAQLLDFVSQYCLAESVETLVLGQITRKDGTAPAHEADIQRFIEDFKAKFPNIKIERQDEAGTSMIASDIIMKSGAKRKQRQDKGLIDKVSAVVILEHFLGWS